MKSIGVKTVRGKRLVKLKEIFIYYFKDYFFVDLLFILILCIGLGRGIEEVIPYFRMLILFKVKEWRNRLETVENFFFHNFYKEQYWALIKVVLINFIFTHCVAILLIAMSSLSATNNWMVKFGIYHSPWHEKYMWAYYWGNTAMLTIGFGDITPATAHEAFCLTFI